MTIVVAVNFTSDGITNLLISKEQSNFQPFSGQTLVVRIFSPTAKPYRCIAACFVRLSKILHQKSLKKLSKFL